MTRDFVEKKVDEMNEMVCEKIEGVEKKIDQKLAKIMSLIYTKNITE